MGSMVDCWNARDRDQAVQLVRNKELQQTEGDETQHSAEVQEFWKAKQQKDIETLISMLNDTTEVEEKSKREWADDLTHLGAGVAQCLEQMLDGKNEEKVNDIVKRSSAIARLLENLRNEQRDMIEQSIILLNRVIDPKASDLFLIDELIQNDGLELLGNCLDDKKESLRALVSFIIRNVYVGKPVYMRLFHSNIVMKKMIAILPNYEDTGNLLDHLLNLEDYMYNSNQDILKENVIYLVKQGLLASLDETQKTIEKMREVGDQKFVDSGQDLDSGMERMKNSLYKVLRESSDPPAPLRIAHN